MFITDLDLFLSKLVVGGLALGAVGCVPQVGAGFVITV